MLPNEHNNTIDIDSARAQRQQSVPRVPLLSRPRSFQDVHHQLSQQLQTTLEADRLLSLFFDLVGGLVPLAALGYRHGETELHLELGEAATHAVTYRMRHAGSDLGELELRSRSRFGDHDLAQLEGLIGCLFYPLSNALLYRRALQAATRDPLTDVGNRVAMNQMLAREVELSRRHGLPLSVIMLDMDHFKALNDQHGHQAGDQALRQVAGVLKSQLRNADMVFRFGGEEFVVLLSNTASEPAAIVGERLRSAVENLPFLTPDDRRVRLSISLGCASYQPPETVEQLLHRADEALYHAKRGGRNRLSLAV